MFVGRGVVRTVHTDRRGVVCLIHTGAGVGVVEVCVDVPEAKGVARLLTHYVSAPSVCVIGAVIEIGIVDFHVPSDEMVATGGYTQLAIVTIGIITDLDVTGLCLARPTLGGTGNYRCLDHCREFPIGRCFIQILEPGFVIDIISTGLRFGQETRMPAMVAGLRSRALTFRDIFVPASTNR